MFLVQRRVEYYKVDLTLILIIQCLHSHILMYKVKPHAEYHGQATKTHF